MKKIILKRVSHLVIIDDEVSQLAGQLTTPNSQPGMTAGEQQTEGLPKVAGSSPQEADDELLQAREMELTTCYLQDVGRRE